MAKNLSQKICIALIQCSVTSSKQQNLHHTRELIKKAAERAKAFGGSSANPLPSLIVLPECFNSPYGTQYFNDYAEEIPGETSTMLSQAAKEEQVYIIGGSIPERRSGKLYNTSTSYDPDGNMIMKYSKLHLFDIDVTGRIKFKESESLSAGGNLGTFNISPDLKVGVGICYDIRFAELSMIYTRKGCNLLVFPGAFNMTTGPAHWELLQRARALDNQVYVATCSPARDAGASYVAWGHSTVVSPWGEVLATTEDAEDIVCTEIDLERVQQVRQQIPIHYQRRDDVYALKEII